MWIMRQQSDLRPNRKKGMLVIPRLHTHTHTRIRNKTVNEAAKDLGKKGM